MSGDHDLVDAAGAGRLEDVRRLLESGADASIADDDGVTPLAHARQKGYRAMVEMLERASGTA